MILPQKQEAEELEMPVEMGELYACYIAVSHVSLSRLPVLLTLYSIIIQQKSGKRVFPIDRNSWWWSVLHWYESTYLDLCNITLLHTLSYLMPPPDTSNKFYKARYKR